MILIDSNIPMYLVGSEHSNKEAARRLAESAVSRGEQLLTDAEVLREILHRYLAIDRREAMQPAFDAVLAVTDEVFPVEAVRRGAGEGRGLRGVRIVGAGRRACRDHAALRRLHDHELRLRVR